MVNLVIPNANDGEECLEEIISHTRDDLGRDTPLHFTRFYPAYNSGDYGLDQITPVETLEMARKMALEEGLEYVYIGNIPGHEGENTYCPGCGRLLIERYGFNILGCHLADEGICPRCGFKINLVGLSLVRD